MIRIIYRNTKKKKKRQTWMNLISSLRGCQGLYMRTGDSFNIFTEDICITEQEIVLWEKRQEKIKLISAQKCGWSLRKLHRTLSSKMTLVPPYSGRRTFSPTFTLTGWISPFWKKDRKEKPVRHEVTPQLLLSLLYLKINKNLYYCFTL